MSKLSRLWQSARSRVDKLRPSIRTGMALGAALTAGALLTPLQAQAAGRLRVDTKEGPVKGFFCGPTAQVSQRCTVSGVAAFLFPEELT